MVKFLTPKTTWNSFKTFKLYTKIVQTMNHGKKCASLMIMIHENSRSIISLHFLFSRKYKPVDILQFFFNRKNLNNLNTGSRWVKQVRGKTGGPQSCGTGTYQQDVTLHLLVYRGVPSPLLPGMVHLPVGCYPPSSGVSCAFSSSPLHGSLTSRMLPSIFWCIVCLLLFSLAWFTYQQNVTLHLLVYCVPSPLLPGMVHLPVGCYPPYSGVLCAYSSYLPVGCYPPSSGVS